MDFLPSIYEHAARVINKSPWEVSRNAELLFRAHAAAYQLYRHSLIVVGIDIYNIEAEAYGSIVEQPGENEIPGIITPICNFVSEILDLEPIDLIKNGRIPMILDVAENLKHRFPNAKISVPVSGVFSIASNLIGLEKLLTSMVLEPDIVCKALSHLVQGQIAFCTEVSKRKLNISFFESAASPPLVSPKQFKKIVLPSLTKIIKKATSLFKHPIACIIGGDTVTIINWVVKAGAGFVICPFETNQEEFMNKLKRFPGVKVRINMDTNILLSGNQKIIFGEIKRVRKLVKLNKNSCIGTGVVPFETEPETILKIRDYIKTISSQ